MEQQKPSNEPLLKDHQDIEALNEDIQKSISIEVRLGFIRKVYAILSAQLFFTTIFIALGFIEAINNFYRTSFSLLIICFILNISLAIALICIKNLARKVPTNYILLLLWTSTEAYIVGALTSFYDIPSVLAAAALTSSVTIALTIYAYKTKTDFTFSGGLLYVGSVLMVFIGFIFLLSGVSSVNFRGLYIFYCCLGVFLYSFYLIYDTQLIMGKFGNKYDIDDYIIAAIMVYLDIINIFVYILEIIGNRR
jgi:protein lifeguard